MCTLPFSQQQLVILLSAATDALYLAHDLPSGMCARPTPSWLAHPFIAAAIASPMPVFPDVASMMVSPGLMSPAFSASVIMLSAGLHV